MGKFRSIPMKWKATLRENKKQFITSAIVFVTCLVIMGIANFGSGIFVQMKEGAENEAVRIENEMEQFKISDSYFTQAIDFESMKKTKIQWNGDAVDSGRWQSDDEYIWDWLSPAFNYGSATEYNETRERYVQQLGNCLFTAQFMSHYDITAKARSMFGVDPSTGDVRPVDYETADNMFKCSAAKSDFHSWPIDRDDNGNYTYLALVNMHAINSTRDSDRYVRSVAFTYKMVRHDNSMYPDVTDFCCWPPDGERPLEYK